MHLWLALALCSTGESFTTPCIYQSYKCGSALVSIDGYTVPELVAAVNQTLSIPPLTSTQLLQVLYRCIYIKGNITGNSFCASGCLVSANMTMDDQCSTTPPTNGTVTVTVTTTVTKPVSPFCFNQCQTFCFNNHYCDLRLASIPAPATVTLHKC